MRLIRISLVVLFAFLLCTACWFDVAPVEVFIQARDQAGNDILDPGSDLFIGDAITMNYDGKDYPMVLPTKVYPAIIKGLELVNYSGVWTLRFGELDGAQNHDETFTLTWPDGTKDVISFKRINISPMTSFDTWRLNGKKTGMPIVIEK
ncbi:MAG: hypothetical protein ACSW72_00440 [Bacteroidales bacterium]